jgi:hypothetical protein
MIIEIICIWVLTIASASIGYLIGREYPTREEVVKALKKKMDNTPVGAVKRPSAEQLRRWKNPKQAAEEQAMIDSLKEFPELQP